MDDNYSAYREFNLERDLMPQLAMWDVLATSGGRRQQLNDYEAKFPVAHGYSVRVLLGFMDTWEVRRVFERGGKLTVKETWTDVYADEVSRVLYEAGCYLHTKDELVRSR